VPVPGTTDQVELNYQVDEKSTGSMMLGMGYSQTGGMVFNTSLTQDNFMGSGKSVSGEFNNSKTETAYGLGYVDPYFTEDGVSLGVGGHYKKLDSSSAQSGYSYDLLSGNFDLGLPTSEYERLYVGFEPQHMTNATCGKSSTNSECDTFLTAEGASFSVFEFSSSWNRDSRNSAVFPDEGSYQRFRAELGAPGGVEYFKINYRHDLFYPITEDYTLLLKADMGVGDGYGDHSTLPFFNRYYAGGEGSIRGFEGNSIGPVDAGGAVGGNIKGVFNAEVILPIPLLESVKSTRISGFVDMGTVANNTSGLSDQLRASAGVTAKWLSPVGPLTFSWAKPLKKKSADTPKLEAFQFRMGQMF